VDDGRGHHSSGAILVIVSRQGACASNTEVAPISEGWHEELVDDGRGHHSQGVTKESEGVLVC
jgi:hypothetical protein